jgi:predicted Zn-ribbon and HTH transcriptional regulator
MGNNDLYKCRECGFSFDGFLRDCPECKSEHVKIQGLIHAKKTRIVICNACGGEFQLLFTTSPSKPDSVECPRCHSVGNYRDKEEQIPLGASPHRNKKALDIQIGGSHYKDFPIQPIEFIIKNKLSFQQGDIIKRIVRYNMPTGKGVEDLKKIKHVIDLMILLEDHFPDSIPIVNEGDSI